MTADYTWWLVQWCFVYIFVICIRKMTHTMWLSHYFVTAYSIRSVYPRLAFRWNVKILFDELCVSIKCFYNCFVGIVITQYQYSLLPSNGFSIMTWDDEAKIHLMRVKVVMFPITPVSVIHKLENVIMIRIYESVHSVLQMVLYKLQLSKLSLLQSTSYIA